MELLLSSKNVILTAGSSYFINGLFCRNSTIIVLDDFIIWQINKYHKLNYANEKIKKNNTVSIIPNVKQNTFYYKDIVSFL